MPADPAPPGELPAPLHARLDRRGISIMAVIGVLTGVVWAGGTAPALAARPVGAPASAPAVPVAAQHLDARVPAARAPAGGSQVAAPAVSAPRPAGAAAPALSASALLGSVHPVGTIAEDMVAASETTALPAAGSVPAPAYTPTAFPPALNPTPRTPTGPPTEVVSQRTANSDTIDNHDGTHTQIISNGMNYRANGSFQPVDLTFHAPGAGLSGVSAIEDHSAVTVSVSAAGVAAVGPEGTGIRLLTPGVATTAGSVASALLGGVTWSFSPTGSGLEIAAVMSSRQGSRSYGFGYALLGGARALSLDAAGNLVSGAFRIGRPVAVGSDGGIYPTGSWSVSGTAIAFSFDDSSLPAAAVPYVLDPPLVWSFTGAVGDSFVNSSSSFGGTGTISTLDASNFLAISDNRQGDGS